MFRKIIAWFISAVILITALPAVPVTASTLENSTPVIERAGFIEWQGLLPAAGDNTFYVEYTGQNLNGLEAVVCTYDNSAYTPVASQIKSRCMGKNNEGFEWYVFKMSMDGGNTLIADTNYYVRMKDSSGKYYDDKNNNNYFMADAQPYYQFLDVDQPNEVSSETGSIPISIRAYGFSPGLSGSDFVVELVHADGMSWGRGYEQEVPTGTPVTVGIMGDVQAYSIERGGYLLEGSVTMNESLHAGHRLYARVTGKSAHGSPERPDWSKYSMSYIRVIEGNTASIGQFNILNSIPCKAFTEGGHFNDTGTYMEANSNTTFTIGSSDTLLYFEITGTNINDPSMLTAKINNEALVLSEVTAGTPKNGIYMLAGKLSLPSAASGKLEFLYNGTPLHETSLNRCSGTGEQGASKSDIEGGLNGLLPRLPANGSFVIDLGYPLNLDCNASKFSAFLTMENNGNNKDNKIVTLNVAESLEHGQLKLIMTTPEELSGEYKLSVLYENNPLPLCGFMGGEMQYWKFDTENTVVSFEKGTEETVLTSAENKNGSLILHGRGFSSSVSYVAYFIPRNSAELNSLEVSAEAQYQSGLSLTIAGSSLGAIPPGWYTIYLKANNVPVNGFTDTALIPESTLKLPTASIAEDYTTVPSITLNVTFGSYSRVKIAESMDALAGADWQTSPPTSCNLSSGYGIKTIYFLFEADNGSTITLRDSITYKNENLGDISSFGVAGANSAGNTLILNKGLSYTLYFTHNDPGLTGTVLFKSESGEILRTETLYRTSGKNDMFTYSKTVKFDSSLENVKILAFSAEDQYGSATAATELAVTLSEKAVINSKKSSFDLTYINNTYYIVAGSAINLYMRGTPGFNAAVELTCRSLGDGAAAVVKQEYALAESESFKGIYSLSSKLPAGTAEILSASYKLTDPTLPENTASEAETIELPITAAAAFTNLDNSDGGYDGAYLYLSSDNPWHHIYQPISGNQAETVFNNLLPGIEYNYSILKNNVTYAKGSLTAAAGKPETVSFAEAGVKVPASVIFTVKGGTLNNYAYIQYSYNQDSFDYNGYAEAGMKLKDFTIGQKIKYTLNLSGSDARKYKLPPTQEFEITEKSNTITIDLDPLTPITVNGAVHDELIPDRRIEGVSVSARQLILNGSTSFWHSAAAVTDSQGQYKLALYPGVEAVIDFSCSGYRPSARKFTPASDNAIFDTPLTYASNNTIRVTLLVHPLIEKDEPSEDLSPAVSDSNQIYLQSISGLAGSAYFNPYSSTIKIAELTPVDAGKTVTMNFGAKNLVLDGPSTVILDPYANGSIEVAARKKGVIAANVPCGGDNPPVAHMLVFDESGRRQGDVITGAGYLTTEQLYLNEGNYTVILLRGYNLTRIKNFDTLSKFNALGLPENTCYIKKTAAVQNGRITNLKDVETPELVTDEMLGAFDVRFETVYLPDSANGEARVIARISPGNIQWNKTILLDSIHWNNSHVYTVKQNSSFVDGKKAYGIGISYYNKDREKLERTLQYTIVPQEAQQMVAAEVDIIYTIDGEEFRDTFREEIPANRLSLEAPFHILQGDAARSIDLKGLAPNGAAVDIYDGEQLVGSAVAGSQNRYSLKTSLTRPDEPGIRFITAKMKIDGKEFSSDEKIVEILNKTSSAYSSHIKFLHYPHGENSSLKTEFYMDDPDNMNFSSTRFYNPYRTTNITFRINNMTKDQIGSAMLIKTYSGVEYSYPAEWVRDVTGAETYSEWELNAILGYIDDFYVQYTAKNTDDISMFTGTQVPDFEKAAAAKADPAQIPSAIRNGTDIKETENTPSSYKMSMKLEGGGTLDYSASYTENSGMTVQMLEEQGYRRFDTIQGSYWVHEGATQSTGAIGTVNCRMVRRVYFDKALTAIINPAPAKTPALLQTSPDLPGESPLMTLRADSSATDDALSVIEMSGNLQNAGEIIYEGLKGAPADLGRFGTAMNAVGGVALAVNIFRGRTTKDAQTLYNALSLIKNSSVRELLRRDIAEYSGMTVKHYTISNVFNGVGYVAGYAGPLGKGLSIITSLGGGWYNSSTGSELNLMWDSIMRSILAELELQDLRLAKKEKQKKVKWYLDPSGYVFEAVESNRVSGIEATLYSSESSQGVFEFWNGAAASNQKNPQITDPDGRYSWDVPRGFWKVMFNGDGYQPAESKEMEVDPMHDQVNIGLISTRKPSILSSALDEDGLEIEFDMFMQAESICNEAAGIMNVEVFDSNHNPVPLQAVNFIISSKNTAYKNDMTYQRDVIYSNNFVKRIRITADETKYPGGFKTFKDDGVTPETYYAVVSKNAKSYSGVNMESDCSSGALSVTARETAAAPSADIPEGSYSSPQKVSLSTQSSRAAIYYTTDGSEPTTLSRVYKGTPVSIEKTGVLKCLASSVGMNDSEVVTLRYYIGTNVPDISAAPTVNVVPGTYSYLQQVELSSSTAGAAIYYTTDGTRPTTGSTLYTGPITVSQSMTIKAFAVKSGYADSGVASFAYIINTEGGNSGGNLGGSSGNSSNITVTVDRTYRTTTVKAEISAAMSAGKAVAEVSSVAINNLVSKAIEKDVNANCIKLGIQTPDEISELSVGIPSSSFADIAGKGDLSLSIASSLATVSFNSRAVKSIAALSKEDSIMFSAAAVSPLDLSEKDRLKVNGRPVYEFNITNGGSHISDFNGGTAEITIPYTLKPGENPNAVVIYHLSGDGSLKAVIGHYNAAAKAVVFKTTHFSMFVIGHNAVSFSDIAAGAWYKNAVEFIAARGITKGTGGNRFSPESRLTRAQFIVLLMNAYNISPDLKTDGNTVNFKDAGNTYYTGYLSAAKSLGISNGTGNNMFAPEREITRQEMFVLLYNALKVIDELPASINDKQLNSFNDAGQIASWANEAVSALLKAGIVSGSGSNLKPEANSTRAEIAQVLYNLLY